MAFDIIGDTHGHADTLEVLLRKLGYVNKFGVYQHPEQRKVAFVGDFIDRGPKMYIPFMLTPYSGMLTPL